MAHGKFQKKHSRRTHKRRSLLMLTLVLLFTISAGGTIAYLIANGGSVTNTFTPAQVSCAVIDGSSNARSTTSGFSVKNTSDIPAYLRATFTVNWKKGNEVLGVQPIEGTDYTITSTNWTQSGGFYYYNGPVPAGEIRDFLTVEKRNTQNNGYELTVEVIAEAIQADGMGASSAQDAWTKAAQ